MFIRRERELKILNNQYKSNKSTEEVDCLIQKCAEIY